MKKRYLVGVLRIHHATLNQYALAVSSSALVLPMSHQAAAQQAAGGAMGQAGSGGGVAGGWGGAVSLTDNGLDGASGRLPPAASSSLTGSSAR